MSFPSALVQMSRGATAQAALLYAMEHDTAQGYIALSAMASALGLEACPGCIVKSAVGEEWAESVLRHERRGDGIIIDFDPNSKLGAQVARLMTDAARPLLAERYAVRIGFFNCCKVIMSRTPSDVVATPAEQVAWQKTTDC